MLTEALLLVGIASFALALVDRPLRRLPVSPAVIYLAMGWLAAGLLGAPPVELLLDHAPAIVVATEFAILLSLFAIGVRLPSAPRGWRIALYMALPGMVVTILLATLAGVMVLGLPWAAALVLGAIMAPTDPVLASDVQIRSAQDSDDVRLALTAEGAMNDGTALPAVMLGLGLLGLHGLGEGGRGWWTADLLWPIGGGTLVGMGLGYVLGHLMRWQLSRGHPLVRDELIYFGAVTLAYGVARTLHLSTFIVAFAVGAVLMLPLREQSLAGHGRKLAERLHDFGSRAERLVEVSTVVAVGVALRGVGVDLGDLLYALLLMLVVRPLAVLAVVRKRTLPQRKLVAWFGIRGIGSLFYLAFALEHGVDGQIARTMVSVTLTCIAVSILLHGVSATPLMLDHQRNRKKSSPPAPAPPPPPAAA